SAMKEDGDRNETIFNRKKYGIIFTSRAGFDAKSRKIVPVGAGRVAGCDENKENCRLKGKAGFSLPDYIGYAFVHQEQQPFRKNIRTGSFPFGF
ncbi:MAG: hypothetical protein GY718_00745, partial [Lentisphaerae bacterium]|nr:hypothetical protein [Lentisphaerota bacterium]